MKNKKRFIFILSSILIVFVIVAGLLCMRKLYNHENAQNRRISALEGNVDYISAKLEQTVNYYNFETDYSDDAINYFAIGNSLTLIGGDIGRGICATKLDNDYFGLVVKYLETQNKKVKSYRYNFASWERSSNRKSTLNLIDAYLSEKLNLVTIQLGANVQKENLPTYEKDLEELVLYVRKKCPNAQIIILGDFWSNEKNEMRKTAAKNASVDFADFSEIIGNKKYQSKEGTEYLLKDGSVAKVSKEAETHPSDLGMEYIANKVIEKIKRLPGQARQ